MFTSPSSAPHGLTSLWALDTHVPFRSSNNTTGGPPCLTAHSKKAMDTSGLDFMTDLPVFNGFICVLMIDRFSKVCKLIPLKGLPTAIKAAEALFHL